MVLRRTYLTLALGAVVAHGLAAQGAMNLSEFAECRGCRVVTHDSILLGAAAGQPGELLTTGGGGIELSVAPDGSFLVWGRRLPEFNVFARTGAFVRTIGRQGEGPGELMTAADVRSLDSLIYVTDPQRRLIVVFNPRGQFVRQQRFLLDGDFAVVDPGLVVAAAWSEQHVGAALHQVDLSSGSVVASLGDGWVGGDETPYGDFQISPAAGTSGSVWVAQGKQLRFERWNVPSRRRELAVAGNLPWFQPPTAWFDGSKAPPMFVVDFAVDRLDRIWILATAPDDRWRTAIEVVRTPSGRMIAQYKDASKVWDTRLYVLDLRSREWSLGATFDDYAQLVIGPAGDVFLFNHFVDFAGLVEKVAIRRLELVR